VRLPSRTGSPSGLLIGRAPACALVGAPFEAIPEPGLLSDEGGHGKGSVLGALEGLGVVEHGVLGVLAKVHEGKDLEKEGMAAEPSGEACDGRRCATHHAGDLAVCGSVDKAGGDGNEEPGTLEKVGEGEGLFREGAPAERAAVPRNATAVGTEERAEVLVGEAARVGKGVLRTVAPGAEGGSETALDLEGLNRPVHASGRGTSRADRESGSDREKSWFGTSSVRPRTPRWSPANAAYSTSSAPPWKGL